MLRLLILLILALSVPPATAQVLPDLAPREVEIRGDLTISFPSLRRQPLIGFNPPPRVPEIDIRRMPFVEAYKQKSAELPQNPLAKPVAPRALPRPYGEGFSGTAEGGFGRYGARYALLETALFSSPSTRWTLDAGYDGITSYAPFGSNSPADGVRGATRYSRSGSGIAFGMEIGGSSESYTLYGVNRSGASGTVQAPSRTRNDGSAGLWLGTGTSAPVDFRVHASYFGGSTSTDIRGDQGDPQERTDRGVETGMDLSAGPLRLDGQVGALTLDPALNDSRSASRFDAGGGLRFEAFGGRTTVEGGARVFGMEALPVATGSVRRTITYVSPSFHVESAVAPNIRLEVTQRPGVQMGRPGELYRTHPFLADDVHIEPVLMTVDALARLRGFWNAFQLSAIATYQESPNWRVFEHTASSAGQYPIGISRITHTAARIMTIGGEARLSPRPGIEARFGARVQDGRLTKADTRIPYLADWTVDAMVSSAFAANKGLLQVTAELIGPRFRDRSEVIEVAAYADLDIRLSYAVGRQVLLILEGRNLLGETPVWDNYPEPPAPILVGVGWRW